MKGGEFGAHVPDRVFESGETYAKTVTAESVTQAMGIVVSSLVVRQFDSTAITRLWIFRRGN